MVKEKYTGPRVKDTGTFIQKARWTHGDRYDYSHSVYVDSTTKVKINCREHGEFHILPSNHASSRQGCPSCSGKRPLRKQLDFYLEKGKCIHNDKYDYSKVVYKGVKTKVEISCPNHGVFYQTLDNHVNNKRGCPSCAENVQKTTAQFISEAREIHGDKYDYSLVNYESSHKLVKIVCPKHGVFEQNPAVHLRPTGCRECYFDSIRKGDQQEFVEFCYSKHNGKYDYSKVGYVNESESVTIICPDHGEFKQSPSNHRRAVVGCPLCVREYSRSSLDRFISQANNVHGEGNFDYGQVSYTVNNQKVKITCKYGHTFWQTPANHLTGFGCQECSEGWGKNGIYGTQNPSGLYILNFENNFIKVGLSKELPRRIKALEKQTGMKVEVIKCIKGPAIRLYYLEKKILRQSELSRYYPEESFAGSTECLELSELTKVLQIIEDWEKGVESSSPTSKSNEESFSETP